MCVYISGANTEGLIFIPVQTVFPAVVAMTEHGPPLLTLWHSCVAVAALYRVAVLGAMCGFAFSPQSMTLEGFLQPFLGLQLCFMASQIFLGS